MRQFRFLFALSAVVAFTMMSFTAGNNGDRASYSVDVKASKGKWTGYKVTGQHTGGVNLQKGTLTFEGDVLVGGNFDIDMNSITCTDMEGEYGNKLVGHLKSEDFFGVDKYPVARLNIVRAIAQSSSGDYKIIGDLTIKSTTKQVKFFAKVVKGVDGIIVSSAKLVIDRSDFDVRYGSGSFFDGLGDKTIYDEFDIEVNLVANTK